MRISPLRAVVVAVAVLGPVLAVAGPASADTARTKTGQTLSVAVTGRLVTGRAVAQGTAKISSGPTTIATVEVSFDGHEDIPVGVDARGRFEVDAPWAPDATSVTVRATVSASDGTTATATAQGRVAKATPRVRHRHLAATGSGANGALAALGAVLLLSGIGLVNWSRKRPDNPV